MVHPQSYPTFIPDTRTQAYPFGPPDDAEGEGGVVLESGIVEEGVVE
jgi:hypothetical protein